jgi:hypothetical protein
MSYLERQEESVMRFLDQLRVDSWPIGDSDENKARELGRPHVHGVSTT